MLWAVTSYFNPFGCPFRRANFREFRRHVPVPLLVVEIVCGTASAGDLAPDDANCVVQVSGDLMWQGERGWNIGLARLPLSVAKVVFIDCDQVFTDPVAWYDMAALLDHVPIVQPFHDIDYLRRDGAVDWSMPAVAVFGGARFAQGERVAYGGAWAFRRGFVDKFGGVYDRFIVGGGDVGLAAAVLGKHDVVPERHMMNDVRRSSYLGWAAPVARMAYGGVGFTNARLMHLWHGSVESRDYHERKHLIADFVPEDVVSTGDSGLRWVQPMRQRRATKPTRVQALADRVEQYFKTWHDRVVAEGGI